MHTSTSGNQRRTNCSTTPRADAGNMLWRRERALSVGRTSSSSTRAITPLRPVTKLEAKPSVFLVRGGGGAPRPGFERLLAAICAGTAGAVFAIEASRLARNGRDWHTLLEFCVVVNSLIIDKW